MKLDLPRDHDFEASVWYSTHASTWYPAHYHDELELKLVLWGHTEYDVGGESVKLGPGSLLWLAPGQEHSLLSVSNDLAMWVASFRSSTVHEAEKASGARVLDRARTWSTCVLAAPRVLELSAIHARLVNCEDPCVVNPLSRQLLTRALSNWLQHVQLCEFESALPRAQPRPLHVAVKRARDLLRGPEADLSLGGLSRRCGLDGPRLSRLFKQQMGLSIVQFRNHFRVQEFIAHFGRGEERNMLQVALDSGFGSYSQFHRQFHQVTGYAPSEHWRRVRAGIVVPSHHGS